jgi:hypothetical protein
MPCIGGQPPGVRISPGQATIAVQVLVLDIADSGICPARKSPREGGEEARIVYSREIAAPITRNSQPAMNLSISSGTACRTDARRRLRLSTSRKLRSLGDARRTGNRPAAEVPRWRASSSARGRGRPPWELARSATRAGPSNFSRCALRADGLCSLRVRPLDPMSFGRMGRRPL